MSKQDIGKMLEDMSFSLDSNVPYAVSTRRKSAKGKIKKMKVVLLINLPFLSSFKQTFCAAI